MNIFFLILYIYMRYLCGRRGGGGLTLRLIIYDCKTLKTRHCFSSYQEIAHVNICNTFCDFLVRYDLKDAGLITTYLIEQMLQTIIIRLTLYAQSINTGNIFYVRSTYIM